MTDPNHTQGTRPEDTEAEQQQLTEACDQPEALQQDTQPLFQDQPETDGRPASQSQDGPTEATSQSPQQQGHIQDDNTPEPTQEEAHQQGYDNPEDNTPSGDPDPGVETPDDQGEEDQDDQGEEDQDDQQQQQPGPDAPGSAGDQAASEELRRLKIVISQEPDRATVGVSRPQADPHMESFPGLTALQALEIAPQVIARAQDKWDHCPRNPNYDPPAKTPAARARKSTRRNQQTPIQQDQGQTQAQEQEQQPELRLF